jgi:DNA-binding transcriptional LysR family regulator
VDKSGVTLERMLTFVRVAERGSFSAVAREQGVGQSTVTRHLTELENALGVTLLSRTTRRIALTAEGALYHEQASAILRLVAEAGDDVRNASDHLSGSIRISCTAALGVRHVTKALFAFQDLHPGIVIDMGLSDQRIDLVKDAVDIAVRLGPLTDSTMERKSIGNSHRILLASRGYLEAHGRPQEPNDLLRHRAILMSNIVGSETLTLHHRDGRTATVSLDGRLMVDHGLAAREALIEGRGIASAHVWLIDDLLASGAVEQVLPDYAPEPVPLSILIVPGRARIRRVRSLIDALAITLSTLPGIR